MEKRNKIIYWIATGLLSALMIMSATMYFLKTDYVISVFDSLGYNERIVIPLAIAKYLGIIAIVSNVSKTLKEWAYFGFLIDFLLAAEGHLAAQDGGHTTPIAAIALWMISYFYGKKVFV